MWQTARKLLTHQRQHQGQMDAQEPACKGKKIIRIARVSAESVDPRYPILLAGLDGSNIENVQLKILR